MKWRIAVVVAVLAAMGLMVSVALGVWTGTQTASGSVSATTASPGLYLCEPEETGVGCGPDDSGADEIFFEGLENLLPSSFASSNLRLRNIGATPLDVLSAEPVVTEVADPGADCDLTPSVTIRVLGKVPYPIDFAWWCGPSGCYPDRCGPMGCFPNRLNDNHGVAFGHATGVQLFPRMLEDPQYVQEPGYGVAVHIEAGDYEDFEVDVMLPATAPDACEENVWDIEIPWQVVSVSHGP